MEGKMIEVEVKAAPDAPPNGAIEDPELGYSFRLPATFPVRQQMRWWSTVQRTSDRGDLFERYWLAARELIEDWKCETLALDADLDQITDPAAVKIIMRVGLAVYTHILALEDIPKK